MAARYFYTYKDMEFLEKRFEAYIDQYPQGAVKKWEQILKLIPRIKSEEALLHLLEIGHTLCAFCRKHDDANCRGCPLYDIYGHCACYKTYPMQRWSEYCSYLRGSYDYDINYAYPEWEDNASDCILFVTSMATVMLDTIVDALRRSDLYECVDATGVVI